MLEYVIIAETEEAVKKKNPVQADDCKIGFPAGLLGKW